MHISTIENPWGKTFTDKRYVHPPLSECIVSMWPSSMVLYGEINSKDPMMSEGTPKKKEAHCLQPVLFLPLSGWKKHMCQNMNLIIR